MRELIEFFYGNEKQIKNEELIIQTLSKHPQEGISIMKLALETSIAQSDLRDSFNRHPDFFVQLEKTKKYLLNRFSVHKGSSTRMIDVLVEEERIKLKKRRKGLFVLFIAVLVILISKLN